MAASRAQGPRPLGEVNAGPRPSAISSAPAANPAFTTAANTASAVARRPGLFPRCRRKSKGVGTEEAGAHRRREGKAEVHRWSPVFAGLCCPFSILLEIPGLTERWYIRTTEAGGGGDVIETRPNAALLDVGLAFSIFFAVIANAALIARFLERKPRLSTLVAISTLTIHDVLNIAIVTAFGVVHSASDGFTYSQSFWMTIASSTASTACNITLIIDFVLVDNFRVKGSGLTTKQRSLVITCMCLLLYLALGSLVYSFLIGTGLDFQDALYFTICTISTVGFGDITPSTPSSRIFAFFYDIIGIVLLAVTIAIARETIIEAFEDSYRRRRAAILEKAKERRAQRQAARVARLARESAYMHTTEAGLGGALAAAVAPVAVAAPRSGVRSQEPRDEGVGRMGRAWWRALAGKLGLGDGRETALQPAEVEAGGLGVPATITECSAIQQGAFERFRSGLLKEEKKEFLTKLSVAMVLFLAFWLSGSAIFMKTESWTYFEALYFSYVFFTTLGYGDYSVKSPAGRGFFIAWSLFGIANMTLLLSVLTEAWQSRYKYAINKHKWRKPLRKRLIRVRSAHGFPSHQESPPGVQDVELQGPTGSDGAAAAVEDLPARLVEAAKGFNQHAIYWMSKKQGDPPDALRRLQQEAAGLDGLEGMKEAGGIADVMGTGETKEMLFILSYGRAFELLTETAEESLAMLRARDRELAELKALTAQLRAVLAAAPSSAPDRTVEIEPDGGLGIDQGSLLERRSFGNGRCGTAPSDARGVVETGTSAESARGPGAEGVSAQSHRRIGLEEGEDPRDRLDEEIVRALTRCERKEAEERGEAVLDASSDSDSDSDGGDDGEDPDAPEKGDGFNGAAPDPRVAAYQRIKPILSGYGIDASTLSFSPSTTSGASAVERHSLGHSLSKIADRVQRRNPIPKLDKPHLPHLPLQLGGHSNVGGSAAGDGRGEGEGSAGARRPDSLAAPVVEVATSHESLQLVTRNGAHGKSIPSSETRSTGFLGLR